MTFKVTSPCVFGCIFDGEKLMGDCRMYDHIECFFNIRRKQKVEDNESRTGLPVDRKVLQRI